MHSSITSFFRFVAIDISLLESTFFFFIYFKGMLAEYKRGVVCRVEHPISQIHQKHVSFSKSIRSSMFEQLNSNNFSKTPTDLTYTSECLRRFYLHFQTTNNNDSYSELLAICGKIRKSCIRDIHLAVNVILLLLLKAQYYGRLARSPRRDYQMIANIYICLKHPPKPIRSQKFGKMYLGKILDTSLHIKVTV